VLKEEQELRNAANNLILVLMINEQLKQGLDSFHALLSMSDYEKRIFENPASMKSFSESKENLVGAIDQFKSTYGSSVISGTYEAFKGALAQPEFCVEAGIKTDLTKSEAATLFNKIFHELSENVQNFPEEADGYAIFIEMVRQSLYPSEKVEPTPDVCTYCGGNPARISKAEFFGESTDDVDGYVWACECGAYAYLSPDGSVVGTIADKALHSSRRRVKSILFELVRLAGITVFEGCKWLSRISEKRITTIQDIEYLNESDCEKAAEGLAAFKKRLKNLNVSYPTNHKELMAFLNDGGRFSAQNAYGYRSGRLFVPIKVGEEAVRVRFRKTVQDIMLPKQLEYQFSGRQFTLNHPTGKREKFMLYAKEQRQALYKEDDNV